MESLTLARHGESIFSARLALNGDPAVAGPLTPTGEDQARALGRALTEAEIHLCVTSEFQRTRETAELALAGRNVPMLVVPELNDHPAGRYEGRPLAEYLEWAHAAPAAELVPGGGESRIDVVARFARGFRGVLKRPERTVLAVLHSLPIVYLLGAAEGRAPAAELPLLPYAEPRRLSVVELRSAIDRLERWAVAPTW